MQSLLDSRGSYLQTEKNVKKYLRSISDKEIKAFFENIELTPFPILLSREYRNRFSKKKSNNKIKSKKRDSVSKTKSNTTGNKSKVRSFRNGTG